MSDSALIALFFLQVASILLLCRGVGLAAPLQPQVLAEIGPGRYRAGGRRYHWDNLHDARNDDPGHDLMVYRLFGLVWRHVPARVNDGRAVLETSH